MLDPEAYEMQTRREYAAAIKSLREDAGLNQQDMADRLGFQSHQGYQAYEYLKRQFKRDVLARLAAALGVTVETIELRRAELAERETPRSVSMPGLSDRSARPFELPMDGRSFNEFELPASAGGAEIIDFSRFFGPEWRVLELAGESMIPYAEPGGFVTYNIKRAPQRLKGCVIKMKNGQFYVKRYDFIRDGRLFVTELHPEERQISFDLRDVEGVYPIGLRLD